MPDASATEDNTRTQVRTFYDAFLRGEAEALLDYVHPEAEFHNPPDAVEGGVRHGPAGFGQALAGMQDTLNYEVVDVEELLVSGETALAMVHFKALGKGSGLQMEGRVAHVLTFREGRILRFEWFRTREDGLRAAGIDA